MKNHYRYAVLLSVVGLAFIHLSSSYIAPENVEANEIKPGWIGKKVTVDGTVHEPQKFNETLIFTLQDSTGSITVAEFRSDTELAKEENVTVTGTVKLYEGRMEIVADSVN